MHGQNRDGFDARMTGEKEYEIGIKCKVKTILVDQSFPDLVKGEFVAAERELQAGTGPGEKTINVVANRATSRILPGVHQSNPHRACPPKTRARDFRNMVNPISQYMYYCYYG